MGIEEFSKNEVSGDVEFWWSSHSSKCDGVRKTEKRRRRRTEVDPFSEVKIPDHTQSNLGGLLSSIRGSRVPSINSSVNVSGKPVPRTV